MTAAVVWKGQQGGKVHRCILAGPSKASETSAVQRTGSLASGTDRDLATPVAAEAATEMRGGMSSNSALKSPVRLLRKMLLRAVLTFCFLTSWRNSSLKMNAPFTRAK